MKIKKSHYENGYYIDTTTNRKYIPKGYCEICGAKTRLTVHHFLEQQKCLRDLEAKKVIFPNTWTKEFIEKNQRLYTLCLQCHSDVHNMSEENFKRMHNKERNKYIF